MLVCCVPALSQEAANPFDLRYRLKTDEAVEVGTEPTETLRTEVRQEPSSDNPFDIIRRGQSPVLEPQKKSEIKSVTVGEKDQPVRKVNTTALFWLLIFLTLFLAVIINLNRLILSNLIRAWLNLNFSNLLHRERKGPDRILYFLLGILFYFNAGIFVSHIAHVYFAFPFSARLVVFTILAFMIIYGIRHMVLYLIAHIFSITKEVRQYSFTIHLFNILNGIVLLVLNYIISFAPEGIGKVAIILGIGMFLMQYAYRNIRGLLLCAKYITSDRIHFFLYLCTCEIIPLIIGFRLIQDLI